VRARSAYKIHSAQRYPPIPHSEFRIPNCFPFPPRRKLKQYRRQEVVRREKHDVDRRETHVYITEKGREMHAKILEALERAEKVMLNNVTEKEQNTVRTILGKMSANLIDEVGGDLIV